MIRHFEPTATMPNYQPALWIFSILLMCVFSGCGEGLHAVSGTITVDGQPLEQGFVYFTATDGGLPARGKIADGKYQMLTDQKNGVKAGHYQTYLRTDVIRIGESESDVQPGTPIPERFKSASESGLEFKVPGDNFDIEIRSDE